MQFTKSILALLKKTINQKQKNINSYRYLIKNVLSYKLFLILILKKIYNRLCSMKRILFFAAVVIFSLSLYGCGHKTNIKPPENHTFVTF